MKPSIYICGPMTGYVNFNFKSFEYAANYIRSTLGYPTSNPADFGADPRHTWADCLKRDLVVMLSCDMVITLPGYEGSKGASLETHVANELGMPVMTLAQFLSSATPAIARPSRIINTIIKGMVKCEKDHELDPPVEPIGIEQTIEPPTQPAEPDPAVLAGIACGDPYAADFLGGGTIPEPIGPATLTDAQAAGLCATYALADEDA